MSRTPLRLACLALLCVPQFAYAQSAHCGPGERCGQLLENRTGPDGINRPSIELGKGAIDRPHADRDRDHARDRDDRADQRHDRNRDWHDRRDRRYDNGRWDMGIFDRPPYDNRYPRAHRDGGDIRLIPLTRNQARKLPPLPRHQGYFRTGEQVVKVDLRSGNILAVVGRYVRR
ncbi:hypothetical protein [Pseudooceanicola aestuarii]|uniref:hypothetical protein n=1 Tax=Pseudooceanicola aestuarii TaxID=2697319 RepID=UPI0013D3223F|nr:hypothetical protein [Pseudooceanicola aestuarii]